MVFSRSCMLKLSRQHAEVINESDGAQRLELEAVKQERSHLMASLASLKTETSLAGGDMQAEDLRRARHELEAKQERYNMLRQVPATAVLAVVLPSAHMLLAQACCQASLWSRGF